MMLLFICPRVMFKEACTSLQIPQIMCHLFALFSLIQLLARSPNLRLNISAILYSFFHGCILYQYLKFSTLYAMNNLCFSLSQIFQRFTSNSNHDDVFPSSTVCQILRCLSKDNANFTKEYVLS